MFLQIMEKRKDFLAFLSAGGAEELDLTVLLAQQHQPGSPGDEIV